MFAFAADQQDAIMQRKALSRPTKLFPRASLASSIPAGTRRERSDRASKGHREQSNQRSLFRCLRPSAGG